MLPYTSNAWAKKIITSFPIRFAPFRLEKKQVSEFTDTRFPTSEYLSRSAEFCFAFQLIGNFLKTEFFQGAPCGPTGFFIPAFESII